MSKKNTGLMLVLSAAVGAAVGAVSYYLMKYKAFNDELDKDFHDYEEDGSGEAKAKEEGASGRTYITLDSGRGTEPEDAASRKETAEAPGGTPADPAQAESADKAAANAPDTAPKRRPEP